MSLSIKSGNFTFYPGPLKVDANASVEIELPVSADLHEQEVALLDHLETSGPLIAVGNLGPAYYATPPFLLENKVEGSDVYGWKPGAERVKQNFLSRVMIIGARKVKERIHLYFSLALEKQDRTPANPQSPIAQEDHYWTPIQNPKLYVQSCGKFIDSMTQLRRKASEEERQSLLSPSISAPIPEISSDKMNRWYFIKEENRSYPLHQLIAVALQNYEKVVLANNSCSSPSNYSKIFLTTPTGLKFGHTWIFLEKDRAVKQVLEAIDAHTFVDWAATSNQKTCGLSTESFENPYILNLNGRTYSKEWIESAVHKLLAADEDLRLEDMILSSSKIKNIILFPNLSFREDATIPTLFPIAFPDSIIQSKPFNLLKAIQGTILGFSEILENTPPDDGMWDFRKIYNHYADSRGLPHFTNEGETIENLIVSNIAFPKHHPKCEPGHLTFKNIQFIGCIFDMSCWCGISVRSSQLVNCTIDLRKMERPATMKRTQLIGCKILIEGWQPKGSFDDIGRIETILTPISNIVENRSDLQNCILESS